MVGTEQVDAQASGTGAQQVHEEVLLVGVEVPHVQLPDDPRRGAVQAHHAPAAPLAERLQHVQGRVELGEDEHLVRPRHVLGIQQAVGAASAGRPVKRAALRQRRASSRAAQPFKLRMTFGDTRVDRLHRRPPRPHVVEEQCGVNALGPLRREAARRVGPVLDRLRLVLLHAAFVCIAPTGAQSHVLRVQVAEQLVEKGEFAAFHDDFLAHSRAFREFTETFGGDAVEHTKVLPLCRRSHDAPWMIAQAAELHEQLQEDANVHQLLLVRVRSSLREQLVSDIQQGLVPCGLARTGRQPYVVHGLGRKLDNSFLPPPKHEEVQERPDHVQ
mmetsp:Transcript_19724/g.63670  ORF Transcript_19724/g.63670 Transcript_19724/m.63670 type:complete len:329 (-) Transcript_19724:29-1015(-)